MDDVRGQGRCEEGGCDIAALPAAARARRCIAACEVGACGHTWSPLSGRASPSLPRPHPSFNEPLSICELGYSVGVFAPGIKGGPAGQYKCGHNLLLAHAKAVKLYREKYLKTQDGKLSMALDGKWGYPYDPSSKAGASRAVAWQGVSGSIIRVLRCNGEGYVALNNCW